VSICEFPLGAGVLRLLERSMDVGVIIDHPGVADVVEVTLRVISITPELFSEDDGVVF
jgi:hypothetical protein